MWVQRPENAIVSCDNSNKTGLHPSLWYRLFLENYCLWIKFHFQFLQDALNTLFVKINEASVAEAYGIEERPSLVVFEKGIPNVYEGDLYDSDIGNLMEFPKLHPSVFGYCKNVKCGSHCQMKQKRILKFFAKHILPRKQSFHFTLRFPLKLKFFSTNCAIFF